MLSNGQMISYLVFFITAWLLIITFLMVKAFATYKSLTKNIDQKDFAAILSQIKKQLATLDKDLSNQQTQIGQITTGLKSHIQKIGYVRYNPFGNTGGSHSFCLCLLDQEDNGIIITSLHSREQTRIYTKEIKQGQPTSGNSLSKEESDSLKKAVAWTKHR